MCCVECESPSVSVSLPIRRARSAFDDRRPDPRDSKANGVAVLRLLRRRPVLTRIDLRHDSFVLLDVLKDIECADNVKFFESRDRSRVHLK